MSIDKRISLTVDAGNAKASIDMLRKEFNGLDSGIKKTRGNLLDYTGALSNSERITKQSLGTTSQADRALLRYDTTLRKLNQALATGSITQHQHATAVQNAELRYQKLSTEVVKSDNHVRRYSGSILGLKNSFFSLTGVVTTLGTALAGNQLVQTLDTYTDFQSRLKITQAAGEDLADTQKKLIDIALETRTPIDDNSLLYLRLSQNVDRATVSQEKLLDIQTTVNKAVSLGGSSAQEAAGAIRQFTQIVGSGFITGFSQELNSIAEQTPGLLKVIVDGMRATSQEFRDLESSGKVGIKALKEFSEKGLGDLDMLLDAIASQSDSVATSFDKVNITVGRGLGNLGTALTVYLGEIDQALGFTSTLANSLNDLSITMGESASNMAIDSETIETIKDVSVFVTSAAVAYGALTAATATYTAIATRAATAQWSLNAAIAANPIGAIAIAIATVATVSFMQFRRQAKATTDELEKVTAKTQAYKDLVDTVGTAERAARAESIRSEIHRLEQLNDVNRLVQLRAERFAEAAKLEQLGAKEGAAAQLALAEMYSKQIAAAGQSADVIAKLKAEYQELTGAVIDANDESENIASPQINDKVQDIINKLSEQARTLNLTSGELARYNVLMAGGTAEEAEFAKSIADNVEFLKNQTAEVNKTESAYNNWVNTAKDGIDPMRKLQREAAMVMEALSRGDFSAEEAREYMKALTSGAEESAVTVHKVKQVLDDYVESAYDYESAFAAVVSSTLQGLENQLTDFVMTGKLNFKDLANSIIADLVRIQIRSAVVAPLANAFSGAFGGGSTTVNAKGNAVMGGQVQRFAKGGLPSLSSYSNSIVNTPTRFAMGAGLMGEAGAEAILPLQRTASGDLGVASTGSSQELTVNVNLTNTAGESMQMQETGRRRSGNTLDIDLVIAQKVNQAIGSGRADQGLRSRFGVTPIGG